MYTQILINQIEHDFVTFFLFTLFVSHFQWVVIRVLRDFNIIVPFHYLYVCQLVAITFRRDVRQVSTDNVTS